MKLFSLALARAHSASALWRANAAGSYLARFALLLVVQYAGIQLSRHFAIPPGFASPLWPPSAIALSACLAWGLRMAPAVWLSVTGACWSATGSLPAALAIGTGALLQACAATLLVRRVMHGLPDFTRHDMVLRFIGIAALCSMISPTVGTAALAQTHRLPPELIALNWLTWWHGNVSGMIIGVPLLLSGRAVAELRHRPLRIAEAGALALLLLVMTQIAFGETAMSIPLAYLPLPFVLWAAFRYNPGLVSWATGAICASAVWNTAHGRGPFIVGSMNTALLLTMTYVSVIGMTGLVVAGLAHQRRRAEHRLQIEHSELERRVRRRTENLSADLAVRKRIEASLREAEERYRTLVESSPDAILVLQDGALVFANRAACALLRADRTERLVGKPVFDVVHPDFHEFLRERMACLARGEPLRASEGKFVGLDGSAVDVEINASPFLHRGKFASLLIARDITERKKNLEQVVRMAYYDALTGLPNRILLRQRLEHALDLAARPGHSLELLFIDLDRFKSINDSMGHAAGDRVLQEAAARLQGILRESDTVARLGGDEFVVLVENGEGARRGRIIAEKILAAFKPPFLQGQESFCVGTSIGIASFPTDGANADTLLKNADIAMYRAKETGRNGYRCYSSETGAACAR